MSFKSKISFEKLILEAGERRLNDYRHREKIQNDELSMKISSQPIEKKVSSQPFNRVIESGRELEEKKDIKLFNNVMNAKLLEVSRYNDFLKESIYKEMKELEHKVDALSSMIDEEEIRIIEKAEVVHSNDFVKENDMNDFEYSSDFNTDPKTRLAFDNSEACEVIRGVGAMLPIEGIADIRPEKAYIVREATDSGDTKKTLIESDIQNILKRNSVFNYVILREEKSNSLYKRETSYSEYPYSRVSSFSFGVKFSSSMYMNSIKLSSCSSLGYEIKKLKALVGKNSWVDIDFNKIEIFGEVNLFFTPLSAKAMEITLEQKSLVGRSQKNPILEDDEKINKRLNSLGFVSNFSFDSEKEGGFYQDFSIRDVSFHLVKFKRKGCFLSESIEVDRPYSVEIRSDELYSANEIILSYDDYNSDSEWQSAVENKALSEFYACLDLIQNDGSRYTNVVPLLNFKEVQKEFVIGSNDKSKVKFFPDFKKNLELHEIESFSVSDKSTAGRIAGIRIKNIFIKYDAKENCYKEIESYSKKDWMEHTFQGKGFWYDSNNPSDSFINVLEIKSKKAHFLKKEDAISFVSTDGNLIGRTKVIEVKDEYSFYISSENIGITSYLHVKENLIDGFTEGKHYFIKDSGFLKVTEDEKELKIGNDFLISVNEGSYYLNFLPIDSSFDFYYENATAGNFYIKFKNLNTSSFYFVEYYHLDDQFLSKDRYIKLKMNSIEFSKEIRGRSGEIKTLIIMRSGTAEAYNSPIVLGYDLIVYEEENKKEEVEVRKSKSNARSTFGIDKRRSSRNVSK